MSQCPHCQHDLSPEAAQSGECPACGHSWEIPHSESADAPDPGGSPDDDLAADAGSLPQAISGLGWPGTGLSSSSEPETWDVDDNALTYEASEMLSDEDSSGNLAPKPLNLEEEDIVRMSVYWGGVDDEIPSGMTVKSRDNDEIDGDQATLDVAALQKAQEVEEFEAADPGKTYDAVVKGPGEPDEQGLSSVSETFISDEFPLPNLMARPKQTKNRSIATLCLKHTLRRRSRTRPNRTTHPTMALGEAATIKPSWRMTAVPESKIQAISAMPR